MPTSKHRKKHKVKAKQRKNEILKQKNAYNKQLRDYEQQVEKMNQQYKEHIAAGGKPEDFNPLKDLMKNVQPEVSEAENKDDEVYGTYEESPEATEITQSNEVIHRNED